MTGLPLSGVRVADFTMNMSGPFATMVLGDQGADVVKVEPPGGDPVRAVGTGTAGMSGYFASLNRSKRSVCLDVRDPGAGDVVRRLVTWADVVVMNFRQGVAQRLGLDAASLRAVNDQLIHVEITGFGDGGPLSSRPAYDHVVQALTGYADLQGDPKDGRPRLVRQGVIDKVTGLATAQAIAAALLERSRTGTGRELRISMVQAALSFLWPDGMMDHTVVAPEYVLPPVANSFRLTATADGHLAFAVMTGSQWSNLLDAFGLRDKWRSTDDLMLHGGAIMREVVRVLGGLPTAEAVSRLAAADIPVAPLVPRSEVHEDPQVVATGAVLTVDHPVLGPIRQSAPAVRFGERPPDRPAPRLGEHTREVLRELAVPEAQVENLLAARDAQAGDATGDPARRP